MASKEQSSHHVHFDDVQNKDDFIEDNSIQFSASPKGILVHLGFLQVRHRYEIELKIPVNHLSNFLDLRNLHLKEDEVPNLCCQLIEQTGIKSDHLHLKINFFTVKEKLLKETFILRNEGNPDEKLCLIITARVLGRGKGTPMLKSNIHCVGVGETDEDSDVSDWVGFSRTDTDEDL